MLERTHTITNEVLEPTTFALAYPTVLPTYCDRGLGSCIVLCAVLMAGAYRVPHAPSQTLARMILIWIPDLVPLFRSARYVGFGLTAKFRETLICQLLVSSTALCRFRDLLFLFFFLVEII